MRSALLLASLALTTGIGCHAGPQPNAAKTAPPISRTDLSATRFIAQHNKNAAAIRSLQAAPSIRIVGDNGERKGIGRADGKLALDRNKNFRLLIETPLNRKLADIGSNEKGFWFWAESDKDRSIYTCDAKDIDSCQLGVALQPEWIMEAMGLRGFTELEASKVSTKVGAEPGTLVLTQLRTDSKRQVYRKETVINEQSGRILEHKLYAGFEQDLLASATISKYTEIRFVNTAADRVGSAEPAETTETVVQIPERFRLNWVKENLAIDVGMSGLKVNPKFGVEQQASLFSEPTIPGTTRQNLARLDSNTTDVPSRVYNSRPMPQTGGIKLGIEPFAAGEENGSRRAIEPVPLSADLSSTPAQPAGVVGALIPSADPAAVQASTVNRWRSPSLGR